MALGEFGIPMMLQNSVCDKIFDLKNLLTGFSPAVGENDAM